MDKTRFIPLLEAQPYFVFLIRPRCFGKTLWLSTLQHYYDINRADQFDQLFGGTYVGDQPTPEHSSYLILFFNFALVNPAMDKVEASFEDNGKAEIESFLRRYQQFFIEDERQAILTAANTEACLRRIFYYAAEKGLKIYLLIDEYDNFANTILTTAGQEAYHNLTHGEGFFRYFFNVSHFFLTWSEKEMGGGFVDFYLEPFLARYRDMPFGYLVELKYSSRNDFNQTQLANKITEAEMQLARYANDPCIQRVAAQVTLKKLVLVYRGWELVYRAEAGADRSLPAVITE